MKTMKVATLIRVFFLLTLTTYIACKKENNVDPVTSESPTIQATKRDNIKRGEPVVFTMGSDSGDNVTWSVNPSENTQISSAGNKASIVFDKAGCYIITAINGNLTAGASQSVKVSDSVYVPGASTTSAAYASESLMGDDIKI